MIVSLRYAQRLASVAVLGLALRVSPQPVRPFAGSNAYALEVFKDPNNVEWMFKIYSDGYQRLDHPVNLLVVNTQTQRLTVVKAVNSLDKQISKVSFSAIALECWKQTGQKPADLREILGYSLSEPNMDLAVADCRQTMGLDATTSFDVSSEEADESRRGCWDRLVGASYSTSMLRAIDSWNVNKHLIQIQVQQADQVRDGNHIFYHFSL